jgi:tyrosine-protein phosphatase YwqE
MYKLSTIYHSICLGDYGGHGNSYHANGGRGNKRAQMRHCLRLLRSMCSTEDEAVLQDLCDQGAISQITGTWLGGVYGTLNREWG